MSAPATTADPRERSVSMRAIMRPAPRARNVTPRVSLDVRLSERWGCQVTTARARREQAVQNVADVMEECLRIGDTDRLGKILNLFDAVLAGHPDLPRLDAIYQHDRTDAEEDMAQAEFRRNPCLRTARQWFDALGREGRSNEPAMAALRREWGF